MRWCDACKAPPLLQVDASFVFLNSLGIDLWLYSLKNWNKIKYLVLEPFFNGHQTPHVVICVDKFHPSWKFVMVKQQVGIGHDTYASEASWRSELLTDCMGMNLLPFGIFFNNFFNNFFLLELLDTTMTQFASKKLLHHMFEGNNMEKNDSALPSACLWIIGCLRKEKRKTIQKKKKKSFASSDRLMIANGWDCPL